MGQFETQLRQLVKNTILETTEPLKQGYALVTGTLGLDIDKIYRLECEVVIPEAEFETIKNVLSNSGIIPKEHKELRFKNLEQLLHGFIDEDGDCIEGILSSKNLRNHLRLYSPTSTELSRGIIHDLSKDDYDKLCRIWRENNFSDEGQWPDGWPRHTQSDESASDCPWCYARFKKIGGTGNPRSPGGYLAKKTIRNKLNSGEPGWVCGDPVRPRFFDKPTSSDREKFGRQASAGSDIEWIQYQYNEIVQVVLNEYKQDIIDAIADRLSLETNQQFNGLSFKDLILGPPGPDGIPNNVEFVVPQKAYTKRFKGAPPHLQHKYREMPSDVYLNEQIYRVYNIDINVYLDNKSTSNEMDNRLENNPWLQGYSRKDVEQTIKTSMPSLFDMLYQAVSQSLSQDKVIESGIEINTPSGQTFPTFIIPTGIKNLNFLIDPFMPTKMSEIIKRPDYHGEKDLPTFVSRSKKTGIEEIHGLHKSELYYAIGSSGHILYDDFNQWLIENFGQYNFSLAPWDPIKPTPIDQDGNIYIILDDSLLIIDKGDWHKSKNAAEAETRQYELPGNIVDEDDENYIIKVNANNCQICLTYAKKLGIKADSAKSEELASSLKRRANAYRERFAKSHKEIIKKNKVISIEKISFDDANMAEGMKKSTNLGRDLETYSLWSNPWLILNLKRLSRANEVEHPYERGKIIPVKGPGGLFDVLLNDLKNKSSQSYLYKVIDGDEEIWVDAQTANAKVKTGKAFYGLDNDGNPIKKIGSEAMTRVLRSTRRKLLNYVRNYDLMLLKKKVKFLPEGEVDISQLDWMDKIAIPINNQKDTIVTKTFEFDPSKSADYDEWLAFKKAVSTDLYYSVVPHSIIKKQLGLPADAQLKMTTKFAPGEKPYASLASLDKPSKIEVTDVEAELADQLGTAPETEEPETDAEDEYDDDDLLDIPAGPGATPYDIDDKESYEPESYEEYDFDIEEPEDEDLDKEDEDQDLDFDLFGGEE